MKNRGTIDRVVSPTVHMARTLSRKARIARRDGWPDVAAKVQVTVDRLMRRARWAKAERTKAGVYQGGPR